MTLAPRVPAMPPTPPGGRPRPPTGRPTGRLRPPTVPRAASEHGATVADGVPPWYLTESASTQSQTALLTDPGLAQRKSDGRWNRYNLQTAVANLLPGHRCELCGKRVVPGDAPTLYRRGDGTHFYGGVRSCGSVWVCPYCAAKVGARRAEELRRGIRTARAQGLTAYLATFTASHHAGHELDWLLSAMTGAQRRLKSGRDWQAWKESVGYVGSVRNGEVTWGEATGWHVHTHAVWFTQRPITAQDEAELRRLYELAADKEGLHVGEHGLDLTSANSRVSGYLTKLGRPAWAAPEELTMAHYKRAGAERFGPFDLVREWMATRRSDPQAASRFAALFRSYASAFHGRRQLYWSKGLRERLGLNVELSDEDAANERHDAAELVHEFRPSEWRVACRGGNRWLLLDAADHGGVTEFRELLADLLGPGWFDPVAEGWSSAVSAGRGPEAAWGEDSHLSWFPN